MYYKKSADLKDPIGICRYANCLSNGTGVKIDPNVAIELLRKVDYNEVAQYAL